MKVLITLAGTALSQTVLPETLPFGEGFGEYDLGDYNLGDYGLGTNQDPDVPYALLDSLADDPDAVVDYFESGKFIEIINLFYIYFMILVSLLYTYEIMSME